MFMQDIGQTCTVGHLEIIIIVVKAVTAYFILHGIEVSPHSLPTCMYTVIRTKFLSIVILSSFHSLTAIFSITLLVIRAVICAVSQSVQMCDTFDSANMLWMPLCRPARLL